MVTFDYIVYSLTVVVVARPAAAWSGAPGNAREARRADSRHPVRKRGKLSSTVSTFPNEESNCFYIITLVFHGKLASRPYGLLRYYYGAPSGMQR